MVITMATMNVIIERELYCEMELRLAQICGRSDVELFFVNPNLNTDCKYSYLGDTKISNPKKFYKSLLDGFATLHRETIDSEDIERICDIAATASNM
jgi:hypothetical protein